MTLYLIPVVQMLALALLGYLLRVDRGQGRCVVKVEIRLIEADKTVYVVEGNALDRMECRFNSGCGPLIGHKLLEGFDFNPIVTDIEPRSGKDGG